MAVYVIAHVTRIKDLKAYEGYRAKVESTMEPYGGRFLIRGTPTVVEGEPFGRLALFEFPDLAAARRWYDSAEYRPLREERARAADVSVGIIESPE